MSQKTKCFPKSFTCAAKFDTAVSFISYMIYVLSITYNYMIYILSIIHSFIIHFSNVATRDEGESSETAF